MVKISGNYRWFEGAHFDHAYYQTEHMRLTRELLRPLGLLRLESDRTLSAQPPAAGQIIATSHACFATLAAAQAALQQAGAALLADLPNYTSIRPELHLSEVGSHLET
jgi:uncharacterized protein (TIGR02118 family)